MQSKHRELQAQATSDADKIGGFWHGVWGTQEFVTKLGEGLPEFVVT